jgi:hypothetical protein
VKLEQADQVVEYLCSKCKAVSSNHSTVKKSENYKSNCQLASSWQQQRQVMRQFNMVRENNWHPRILFSDRLKFKREKQLKTSPGKQKFKSITTHNSLTKEY